MNYENMTLKEKVFQTFIVTIREINKHGGPKEFFKKYPVGGMYYGQSKDPDIENKVETEDTITIEVEQLQLLKSNFENWQGQKI